MEDQAKETVEGWDHPGPNPTVPRFFEGELGRCVIRPIGGRDPDSMDPEGPPHLSAPQVVVPSVGGSHPEQGMDLRRLIVARKRG